MFERVSRGLMVALPVAASVLLLGIVAETWAARLFYPYDLEWMEGGMLVHAWRLQQGLPLYVPPSLDFAPYNYPPGYPALVAALGEIFGLSLALGRALSIAGTGSAAAAVAFVVHRHGGQPVVAFGCAAVFVGTYDASGAFYDLVRPDAVALGLAAWSVALALEPRRGAPIASGLLLAAAFLCKHNLAALGVPLLVGLWIRDGWRPAAAFAAASAGPALAATGILQVRSGGHFLTYLIEVPLSHPALFERAWLWMPREIGTPLPVACGLAGLWAVHAATARHDGWPRWVGAVVPVWCGLVYAWLGTYNPPAAESGVHNFPSSFAFWALAASPVALAVWVVGAWRDGRPGIGPGWRVAVGAGVAATTVLLAGWMRAHAGGFLNVHLPVLWCLAVGFGAILVRAPWPRLAAAALTLQLVWLSGLYDRERLKPTPEDVALGDRFVEALRGVEGPILSPYAAWLPTYAGHPPSLHYMGVWDADYPGGPYRHHIQTFEDALADQHWTLIVGSNQKFLRGLTDDYQPTEEFVDANAKPLMPKTGWRARPWRLLIPKER